MAYYTVDDLPAGAAAAAFCPVPPPVVTNPAESSWGLISRVVHGMLNAWQPSPPPPSMMSAQPTTQPSFQATMWKPNIYWGEPAPGFARATVAGLNREEVPIPAGSPQGGSPVTGAAQQAPVAMKRPRFTGRKQTAWPRAFQRWAPGFGTQNGGQGG